MSRQFFRCGFAGASGDPDNPMSPLLVNLPRQCLQGGNRIINQQQPICDFFQLRIAVDAFTSRHRGDCAMCQRLSDKVVSVGKVSVKTSTFVVRLRQRDFHRLGAFEPERLEFIQHLDRTVVAGRAVTLPDDVAEFGFVNAAVDETEFRRGKRRWEGGPPW